MATYIIRRVIAMIPALIGITLITFVLMHSTKGGPFTSEHSDPQITAALNQAYGLDKPLWPTFYGPQAGILQTTVLVLGLVLVLGGLGMNLYSRRRAAYAVTYREEVSASTQIQQFVPLIVTVGGVLLFWWVVMFLQGTPKTGDRPFTAGQYLQFIWNLLQFNLGPSFSQKSQTVTQIIVPAASNSFILGASAFCLLVAVSVPLGTLAALRQNTWVDYLATAFSLVGYSIPNFVLAILLILFVSLGLAEKVGLGWLPIAGWGEAKYLVLPAFVLAIRPMAVLTRLTRASMIEVLNQDYIRTAWSKGLGQRVIIVKHALRNALLPVVTVLGDQLGDLVTGSLVIETIFAVPGIGFFFVNSVNQRDYGMIMGTTIFYATLVLVINLIVDLLYGIIDPRVRLGAAARS